MDICVGSVHKRENGVFILSFGVWMPCCCCCLAASVVSGSVRPHRWQPTRLPHPWDSPGKSTGVGCHFLLQCRKVKSESVEDLLDAEADMWNEVVNLCVEMLSIQPSKESLSIQFLHTPA